MRVRVGAMVVLKAVAMLLASSTTVGASGATADLVITLDDGSPTAVPGETVTYTLVASNPSGPDPIVGAAVVDLFPEELSCVWTCVASASADCKAGPEDGDIVDLADLPVGASATYTAVCDLDASASGMLGNTATIMPPEGAVDSDPSNNSATDSDTLTPLADLGITKDDGLSTAVPGEVVEYVITVSNDGPSDAVGAEVSDLFPAELACSWTCAPAPGATCTSGPVSGDLVDTANVPTGSSVIYTASCLIDSGATSSVVNTATVGAPAGTTDLNGANDSATDAVALAPEADLQIVKTDGSPTAVPGTAITYTLTVTNLGPSDASGAVVSDAFPAELGDVAWACVASSGGSCTASGIGDLADTISLSAGGTAIYTAIGLLDPTATGTLTNTATVTPPAGIPDTDASNDSSTDVDALVPTADLAITKDDGQTSAEPGTQVTYTLTASNGGPSAAIGATVSDLFPVEVTDAAWTCFASEGAVCGAAAGSGDIAESVDLGVGASVTYSATVTLDPGATGLLTNTATVAVPAGTVDPVAANDSATDVDTLDPAADLTISKTDGQSTAILGLPLTYTLAATNSGPGDASAAVLDTFPGLVGVTWTCVASGGASCAASGAGSLSEAVTVPVGGSVVFTATGTVALDASSPLTNTATVVPTSGLTDPDATNNTATDETDLLPGTDLAITKDDGRRAISEGDELTYIVVVSNLGPGDVVGARVDDVFPAELESCSWSCVPAGGASCTTSTVLGDLVDTVDIPAGDSVTYTATCAVAPGAVEVFNVATASVPAGVVELDPANDSDSDLTLVALFADGFESGDISGWSRSSGRDSGIRIELRHGRRVLLYEPPPSGLSDQTPRKIDEGANHGLD